MNSRRENGDAADIAMPHGTDNLLLQLFVIFVWAKVFGEFFERLRLPAVLGEILAGVLLGPFALRMVIPTDTVASVAELGAVFLLFTIGLETSPAELIRVGRMALVVAFAGDAVTFLLGFALLRWHGEASQEAVFIAAAMVATSVGITARVLRDLHVLRRRTSRIILGAAVFDDILGMVLLGVVVGLASDGHAHWLRLGIVTLEAAAFAAFMIFIGPRVVKRIRPSLGHLQTREAPLILALGLCLGLSAMAASIGMAAFIGAFFAGLICADQSRDWNLQSRTQGINQLLAPVFFFTIGARLDLGAFDRRGLALAAIVSALALVSKLVGCGVPMFREGWRSALQVGVGMTPRGEVALVVALMGLELHLISPRAYAVVIFMTAVTTLLPPPFLKLLYRDTEASPPTPADEEEEQKAAQNLEGNLG